MVKRPESKPRRTRSESEVAGLAPSNSAEVTNALQQVADLLTSADKKLQQFAGSQAGAAAEPQINSWKDPFTEAVATINPRIASPTVVTMAAKPFSKLRTNIVEQQPPPARYAPGTAEFRYWVAAEALARGINFWGPLLPAGTTWSTANPMKVTLIDEDAALNANYSRPFGLRFFRQKVQNFDICACESPDVLCHELGHAVLDALRPQLFNVANTEAAAFHESFGDMSAILCALQLPSMRQTVITETSGRLNVNSRLSRLAEQLGWGIRQLSPTAVDRDCLRNAANRFFYDRPDRLPPSAPSSLLSTEEHSFSRIFTGAFLDALARIFIANGAPSEASLLAVSRDLGQLLIDAVHGAPVTTAYFSQVAAALVQADQARFGGRHRAELSGAFLEHGILSVASTIEIAKAPVPEAVIPAAGMVSRFDAAGAPSIYTYEDRRADDAFLLGLGETPELQRRTITVANGITLDVHAPDERPRFAVASAMAGAMSAGVFDQDMAALSFVEGLIQRRDVELGREMKLAGDTSRKDSQRVTHSLAVEDGKTVLKRNHFSCGCRHSAARIACN